MATQAFSLPDSSALLSTPSLQARRVNSQAKAAAQGKEFESVFLGQVLNSLTQGLGEKTGFDGGSAEQQWRSILNEHVGRAVAAKGGVGIASAVARELLRNQEAARQ